MRTTCLLVAFAALIVIGATRTMGGGPTTAPATAPAATVTGTWSYTLHMGDLAIDSYVELKQVGTALSGNVVTGVAKTGQEITNGTITGNEIAFTVDKAFEQGTLRTKYRGTVDGDRIRGTAEVGWIDNPGHTEVSKVEWVATRIPSGGQPTHGLR